MARFTPCLWFDHQAEQAADFYKTVFERVRVGRKSHYTKSGAAMSGQKEGATMMVEVQIEDLTLEFLNAGPVFKFTPAISFTVACEDEKEIDETWRKLAAGGTARMELAKYPWAEKYGWTTDRFGVEWQLMISPQAKRKVVPTLLFVDKLFGRGQEALDFYMSIFPNSEIESIARDEATKTVMHCSFTLDGQGFFLMEGAGTHRWTFSEATSLIVNCKSQAELDQYWSKLTAGGEEQPCGWLKDKFGVSWQVVPVVFADWMSDPNKSEKAFAAMAGMKKLDIDTLMRAIT